METRNTMISKVKETLPFMFKLKWKWIDAECFSGAFTLKCEPFDYMYKASVWSKEDFVDEIIDRIKLHPTFLEKHKINLNK